MVDAEDSKSFAERRGGSSPSTPTNYYDAKQRQHEKQLSREQDDRNLQAGIITARELTDHNSFFSSLNFEGSVIKRRD